jgi:peptidoglycan hydrolase-like protein with peptidoglycan-binding domain
MKVLKIGDRGDDVRKWQFFLTGQGFNPGEVDGIFGEQTYQATKSFQGVHQLKPDGVVGNRTVGTAMLLGFNTLTDNRTSIMGANWPPKPDFSPLLGNAARTAVFGQFSYRPYPLPSNPENLKVTDNWAVQHIVRVSIPQLVHIKGNPWVYFHRLAANQLIQVWQAWEQAGLLRLILTWDGAYAPRFI